MPQIRYIQSVYVRGQVWGYGRAEGARGEHEGNTSCVSRVARGKTSWKDEIRKLDGATRPRLYTATMKRKSGRLASGRDVTPKKTMVEGDRGRALRPPLIIRSFAQRIGPETGCWKALTPGKGPVRLKHLASQWQAIGCVF